MLIGAAAGGVGGLACQLALRTGATVIGTSSVANHESLRALATLIADGEIVLPIDRVFPLDQVQDAYRYLMAGHLHGKVVLATR